MIKEIERLYPAVVALAYLYPLCVAFANEILISYWTKSEHIEPKDAVVLQRKSYIQLQTAMVKTSCLAFSLWAAIKVIS